MFLRAIAGITLSASLTLGSISTVSAQSLTTETRELRTDVSQTIGTYVTTYGDRVSPQDKSQLLTLARQADKELRNVQRAITKADNIPASQRSRKLIAINSAIRTHTAARTRAETAFSTARSILEPQLSIFESLSALSDYNRLMNSFNELEAGLTAERSALR